MSKWKSRAKAITRNAAAMRVVDSVTAVGLRVASPPYFLFTKLGPARQPSSTKSLKRMGLFPIRDHYYQPLFNDAHLVKPLSEVRRLPGIDWRHESQMSLLSELGFSDELLALHLGSPPTSDIEFFIENGGFESGDADFLYSMIRHLKPGRVFEVGSGNSTKIAQLALKRNTTETGRVAEHVCIEPYEMPWLEQLGVRVIRERVEDVGLELFSQLEPNDLLFIDSSHMIRPQGDVLFEYLELLPSLASGVFVHVHDIFTPRDYPDQWVRTDIRMWNEQYLLEALLSNSDRYEIVAALNYLQHVEYDRLSAVCPYLTPQREPGSFYFRIQ
jgi:predicted O-methyltransferase YrrM